jgi:hypothetical protein
MQEARETILVTSYVAPDGWWLTAAGEDYGQRTSAALKRVKSLERIFIVDSDREVGLLLPIIRAQASAGCGVKAAKSAELAQELRSDFMVIDGEMAAEMVLDGQRHFVEGRFYLSRAKARDYTDRYRRIAVWAKAPRRW